MHNNQKFLARIQGLGYCCPSSFFHQLRNYNTQQIGNLLGVKARTIRFWKARASYTRCTKCAECH